VKLLMPLLELGGGTVTLKSRVIERHPGKTILHRTRAPEHDPSTVSTGSF